MGQRIKCACCGKVLESKSRHDFQGCGCENDTFIDGGDEYTRIGAVDLSKVLLIHPNGDEVSLL